ncbi:Clavaminate synthase-like protein [Imleria badia]|nr:Clavaminate synthase-like protein [Imleria badia]
MSLVEYARRVLGAPQPDADFPPAVRDLLNHRHVTAPMDHFLRTAHRRMPGDPAWRMLYIDAAVLKVLARASLPGLDEHVARECIATLDHAIVIAGAATDDARRDYVVHDVIKQLQSAIPWRPPSSAVLVADSVPRPPSTNSIPAFVALPSIFAAQKHWSRAPFVIPGCAHLWPAMHQWASLSYLFSVSGPGRVVPVEVGDDYRSDDWSHKLISWEEFLSSLDPSSTAHRQHHTLYLAQHSLLSQFPQLRDDIILPDIVYASLDAPDFPAYNPPSSVILNAWLGPKGTISPAHTDPFFNCYVQVVGRKTVWLAPPNVAAAMYPYPSSPLAPDRSHNPAANATSPLLSNTSQVDVFLETEVSQTAFPLFWDTVPDKASSVTLSPGDLLFFPPGWWHAMRSEDVSFSVSMWF